jgi:hypothetical protein
MTIQLTLIRPNNLVEPLKRSIFAEWFFHNSIRFKVNKDWIREFVRIPFFFATFFFPFRNSAILRQAVQNNVRKKIFKKSYHATFSPFYAFK